MRRILVEKARHKQRLRHGGERMRVPLDEADLALPKPDEELLALDKTLTRLATDVPRVAQLVQLRFFAGLSQDNAAMALDISSATAKRDWRYTRAWLHREVCKGDEANGSN